MCSPRIAGGRERGHRHSLFPRYQPAAALTILLVALDAHAARRPRYGGELRVEIRAALASADPSQEPANDFSSSVFETLVRMDEHGDPQPWLAISWSHDTAHKRWIFTPRPNVILHDGSLWNPPGGMIAVPDDKPIDQILGEYARRKNAIFVRGAGGALLGTGPFRIARWEPGRSARLEAHESYWRGRPFLDAVELRMARSLREQSLDLDSGKADAVEVEVTDQRRLRQQGISVPASKPLELITLIFDNLKIPSATREALDLAIDRATIQRVLLDRQGEITGSLFPQWLTGYAFLFPVTRDVTRAKTLVRSLSPIAFGYDRNDMLIRSVAERLAVNASEAGITLRPVVGPADLRLVRMNAVEEFGELRSNSPAAGYEAERALLKDHQLIPLFHLPFVHAVSAAVRGFSSGRLEDVWIEPAP